MLIGGTLAEARSAPLAVVTIYPHTVFHIHALMMEYCVTKGQRRPGSEIAPDQAKRVPLKEPSLAPYCRDGTGPSLQSELFAWLR